MTGTSCLDSRRTARAQPSPAWSPWTSRGRGPDHDTGRDAPRAGWEFSDLPIAPGIKSEAAFGVCDSDEVKCQAPPVPAPPGPAPAPPAPGPGAGAGPAPAPAPVVHTEPVITWSRSYTADNNPGASTTVEQPFAPTYRAIRDPASGVWRMDVTSVAGGVDIRVHQGGSRDPVASPPTTEAEARAAVTDMKGYYARGSRGDWHTEAASRSHENHHYDEWRCTSDDYWRTARWRINQLTAPVAGNPTEAAATATMRAGAGGADAIMASFRTVAHTYWFMLPDNARSRPYAAGQIVLNRVVRAIQSLAASRTWTVPQGTESPSAANPCFLPKPLWPA